ncbi:class I SAM-dependent methyltransferase [Nigerium massiliense]|uniref:class I SAM-dependent methyltransferase n=1 Tax=Nigerium massiliense TaxID=1522317 RepID=UPI0036F3F0AC
MQRARLPRRDRHGDAGRGDTAAAEASDDDVPVPAGEGEVAGRFVEFLVARAGLDLERPVDGATMIRMDDDGAHDPRSAQGDPHRRVDPYEGDAPMWSGDPNQALVAEVAGMRPGRAVDVGSGEGADALWLAQRGWRVTAVEPSPNAMRRARDAADAAGADVDWVQATLLDAGLPTAAFDLVSCFYPALFRSPGRDAERTLAGLVAPGGSLLFVSHAEVDRERALAHGFDPDGYVDHVAIRDALGDGWVVERDERRERHVAGGGGAHHHTDLVLVARRA